MATAQDVKDFLREFKIKTSIYNVLFRDDRQINTIALLALDIPIFERKKILNELDFTDYYQGPLEDKLNYLPPMWVFGKTIKGKEIYIKITLGPENSSTICISFHLAQSSITYPFKK